MRLYLMGRMGGHLFLHIEVFFLFHFFFLSPCNIYLTESGDWKLFGFNFCKEITGSEGVGLEGWDFTDDKS